MEQIVELKWKWETNEHTVYQNKSAILRDHRADGSMNASSKGEIAQDETARRNLKKAYIQE